MITLVSLGTRILAVGEKYTNIKIKEVKFL